MLTSFKAKTTKSPIIAFGKFSPRYSIILGISFLFNIKKGRALIIKVTKADVINILDMCSFFSPSIFFLKNIRLNIINIIAGIIKLFFPKIKRYKNETTRPIANKNSSF